MQFSKFKAIVLLLVIIAIPIAAIGQTQKPTLIVMQFFGDASTDPAVIKQVNEIFESNIITTNYFLIKDRDSVLAWFSQTGLDPKKLTADDIINLAKTVKADFVITGTLTRTGSGIYTVNPRVTAADTGREVYSKPVTFSADALLKALEDLAAKIVVAVRQRTDVTLAQVDALIQIKDWQSALNYLEIYERIHPDDTQKTSAYRSIIYKALGEQAFADAKRALDLSLFESARNSIGLALKYEPDNIKYREFSDLVEQQYSAMRQQTEADIFKKLDELRIREQWETGLALLQYLESTGSKNPKIAAYKEEFTKRSKARTYYMEAQNNYLAGDFSGAVLNIEKALELYPDNETYQKFRVKVVELERRDKASRAQWGRYMEEARSFSAAELFLLYRKNISNVFIALDFPVITVLPAQELSIPVNDNGAVLLDPQFGLGAWFRGTITSEYSITSFLSINAGWYSGINFGYALAEHAETPYYSGGYYTLYQLGSFYFDIFGGADACLTVYGFSLTFGLELAPSFYSVAYQKTVPYLDTSEKSSNGSAAFNGGYRLMLAWNMSERSQLFVLANYRVPLHAVSGSLIVGEKRLSLIAGYSFFWGK